MSVSGLYFQHVCPALSVRLVENICHPPYNAKILLPVTNKESLKNP